MLKTLNFIRKLNKNKKKAIWLKTSHFREGKRKLPALLLNLCKVLIRKILIKTKKFRVNLSKNFFF
jgi:uncharacterized membrane protein YqhA